MGKDLFRYKGMKRILTLITCLTLIQTAAIIMQAEWLSEGRNRTVQREGHYLPFSGDQLFPHRFYRPARGDGGATENRLSIRRPDRSRFEEKFS